LRALGRVSAKFAAWTMWAAMAVTVTSFGVAAGLGSQFGPGTLEIGQGAEVSEHSLAYWQWHQTELGTIPNPVPARISTTVGTPTLLPRGGRTFTINAAVVGQTGVRWTFQETVAAPTSTELVITLSDSLSQSAGTILVYVETAARAPGGTLNYNFWWDAGTFAPGALTIESLTATVQVCSAIGTCP
jgi:hypothetical protein